MVYLSFLMLYSVTGCFGQAEQTAFRVRSDISAGLNADLGWAGALNEDVTIFTDEPFRVRFEIVGSDGMDADQRFNLQYRRNEGEWKNIDAQDFPKPDNTLVYDFKTAEADETADDWNVIHGGASGIKVAADEGGNFLRASSNIEPLLVIQSNETDWEIKELIATFRLPGGNSNGAGIIFGYVDPDNYYRILLDVDGILRLSRFADGTESVVAEEKATAATDRWLKLEVQIEDDGVEIEIDGGVVDMMAGLDNLGPQSKIGFYVPQKSTIELREFELEGESSSPPVSIIASKAYENGEETSNLLAGSKAEFIPGAGISLRRKTIPWSGKMAQSEWEWPLVIRRFADGAVTNDEGDVFEFRMVDANYKPFEGSKNPVLSLSIPPGHIGGTFIETPGRIGPFQASNGDLYFIIEPTETDNMLMMIKSTDNGISWREVDGRRRPEEGDLEGFAAVLSRHSVHMIHQQTNSTWHHSFRTSDHTTHPDTWEIRDHQIAGHDAPPTQVASLAIRSDGSMVAVYGGPRKLHYKIRSPDGVWDEYEGIIDPDRGLVLSDPQIVIGANDEVHLAYYGNNGTAWYGKILPDGSLTELQLLSTDLQPDPRAKSGSILPLVFIPESNTLKVIYQHRSGYLWKSQITDNGPPSPPVQVSDRKVVYNAVDSEQAGADAIANGKTVHVLFIEDGSGNIYHTYTDKNGDWLPSTLLVDNIKGSWIRGSVYTRLDGERVYGYVYDAGSGGGGGMNKFAELQLNGH